MKPLTFIDLFAGVGMSGHNVPIIKDAYGFRKLTPDECFRFQGYKNFSLPEIAKSHLYQQAGKSVTKPLIERIFGEIKKNSQNRKFIKCTCNVITT